MKLLQEYSFKISKKNIHLTRNILCVHYKKNSTREISKYGLHLQKSQFVFVSGIIDLPLWNLNSDYWNTILWSHIEERDYAWVNQSLKFLLFLQAFFYKFLNGQDCTFMYWSADILLILGNILGKETSFLMLTTI